MPERPLQIDTDELRRRAHTQHEIADQMTTTRVGEDLGSAPAAMPGLKTADACVVAGETVDVLIGDVVRAMSAQSEALKLAADAYKAADDGAASGLSGQMNL